MGISFKNPWWVVVGAVGGLVVCNLALNNPTAPCFFPPTGAARMAALVCFSVGEEPGWRGFALPRLQRRYGPLAASAGMLVDANTPTRTPEGTRSYPASSSAR